MPALEVAEEASKGGKDEPDFQPGRRVSAVWAGNGCSYPATVVEVKSTDGAKAVVVSWDDEGDTHREVPIDKVTDPSEETDGWSIEKIERTASVKDSEEKGRCLFTNKACGPGQVVFVERHTQVVLPSQWQELWDYLKQVHEATPLNLGTVSFHFAGLMSHFKLEAEPIAIIMDKYVPDPDEKGDEDVMRILKSMEEKFPEALKEKPLEPARFQRLVSAWRYNSFGHHMEDGLVLYNRISMCSHSCDPTCCWSYGTDDAFVLRARIALKEGDEITISYLQDEDLLKGTNVRQQKLLNWRFTCACPRCKLNVDNGRGFRCRKCRVGILFATAAATLEPCTVCYACLSPEDTKTLLHLEEEYVTRVDGLDKTDMPDVELVYHAAMEIFERHWMLYVMDTMLWESFRPKNLHDAMEHQRRRIDFHSHYYGRPTFIAAWCHEELGDSLKTQFPDRKWQFREEFQRAYHMLAILCGASHQYTISPYNKLMQDATPAAAT